MILTGESLCRCFSLSLKKSPTHRVPDFFHHSPLQKISSQPEHKMKEKNSYTRVRASAGRRDWRCMEVGVETPSCHSPRKMTSAFSLLPRLLILFSEISKLIRFVFVVIKASIDTQNRPYTISIKRKRNKVFRQKRSYSTFFH